MEFINFSLSASLFVLLVVIIRIAFANHFPKLFYRLLWVAVLIKLLIPFSIPFPFSIYNLLDGNESEEFQTITANEFHYYNNVVSFDVITASTLSDETQNSIYMNLVRVIMLSGSIIIMVFVFINHLIYRRKYALSLPCTDAYIIEWVNTHKICRKYSVRMLDIIKSPVTYGVISPVILLPSCINVNEKQMELILMHEYTHIKRFDVLWKVSYFIMVAVHWFNPIVWLAYIFMNKDLELSCDEAVINSMGYVYKKCYAETLVDLVCVKKQNAFLYNSFSKNLTKERINYIMNYKKTSRIGIAFSIMIAIVFLAAFATDRDTFGVANSTEVDNTVIVYPNIQPHKNYSLLRNIGRNLEIDGIPASEYFIIESPIDNLSIHSSNFYEVAMSNAEIENVTLFNSETIVMTKEDNKGWNLIPKDKLIITLKIDLSDENSDKEGELASVGYYVDSTFVELFYGKIKDEFEISFVPTKEGEYNFYLTNLCAGAQNYKEIKISKGENV